MTRNTALEGTLRRGDLVRLDDRLASYHGCEYGFVHKLHGGSEDSLELRLENGVYTCTDPRRVTLVSEETVNQQPKGHTA